MTNRLTWWAAAFTCLIFFNCGANKLSLLSERTESLNQNLRWSNLPSVALVLDGKQKMTLMERLGRQLDEEKIVDYSIVDLGLAENKTEATVLVEFTYYAINDQSVRKRREMQSWIYSQKKKNWFLTATRDITHNQPER